MSVSQHKPSLPIVFILCIAVFLTGCLGVGIKSDLLLKEEIAQKLGVNFKKLVIGEGGLEWIVRKEGTGEQPQKGEGIATHYTGYLLENGEKFDSSHDRDRAFVTPIGVGKVIKGWDIMFLDMRIGEKRVLFIPSELGYGEQGAGQSIPPGATLVFDVELIRIIK